MQFCECGGMFVGNGMKMKCRSCGKILEKKFEMKISSQKKKEDITVIEDNAPDLPTTQKNCPQCGNERAYFWLIQTRSSDEPPTQFYRCVKCKHTWREYK